ncbi:hypothetical protein CALCODRAFT_478688 [Calocera cornea HHB12733]|uniref:Uncharacterized protein n=1 Tax=Calocera cornea HHB12733 TaxID=1353952 RepID=A0A165K6T6_9BASI|nr:hypothetical protein CALCODRAFT_478688 [Calocera cornea HHB12733]
MLSYPRPAPPSSRRNLHALASSTTPAPAAASTPRVPTYASHTTSLSRSSATSSLSSLPQHLQHSPATQAARMLNIDLASFSFSPSHSLSPSLGDVEIADHLPKEGNEDGEGEEAGMTEEWLSARSRDELGRMLLRAQRVIRERERELGLAASIGKQLLQQNEHIRRRSDRLLARLSISSPRPGWQGGSPRSPGSSIDSLGSVRSVRSGLSAREASVDTASFRKSLFGLEGEDAWSESSVTPQPPAAFRPYITPPRRPSFTPSRTDNSHTHTRTPSLLHLRQENQELQGKLESLEKEAAREEREGRRRLRGLERELDGLRGELDALREEEERGREREEVERRERERERRVERSRERQREREMQREEEERSRSEETEGRRREDSWAAQMHGLSSSDLDGPRLRPVGLSWRDEPAHQPTSSTARNFQTETQEQEEEEEEEEQSPTPSGLRLHPHPHTLASLASVGSLASDRSSYHSFPASPPEGRVGLSGSTSRASGSDGSTASVATSLAEVAQSEEAETALVPSPLRPSHQHTHTRSRALTHTDLPILAALLHKIRELEATNTDLLAQREGMEARLRSAKKGVQVMEEGIGEVARELAGLAQLERESPGEWDLDLGIDGAGMGRMLGMRRERSNSLPSEYSPTTPMREEPTVRAPAPASPRPRAAPSSPLHAQRSRRRKGLPPAFLFPHQRPFDNSAEMRGPLTAPLPVTDRLPPTYTAPYEEGDVLGPLTAPLPPLARFPLSRATSDRSTPTLRHFPRSSSDEEEWQGPRDPFLSDGSELGRSARARTPDVDPLPLSLDFRARTPEVDPLSLGFRARTPDAEQEQLEQGWKRLNDELKRSADLGAGALRKRPSSHRGVRSLGEELARVQGGAVLGTLGAGSLKGTWRFTPLKELEGEEEEEEDSEAEVSAVLRMGGESRSRSRDGGKDKGKGRAVVPMTPPQVNTLDLFEQLNQAIEEDEDEDRAFSGKGRRLDTLLRAGALKNAPATTFELLEKAVEERAAARGGKDGKKGVLGWVEWMLMILLWLDEMFPPRKEDRELDDTYTDSSLAATPETSTVPLPAAGSSTQLQRRAALALDPRLTRIVGDVWLTVLFMWTVGVFMVGVAKKGPRGVLMGEADTRVERR